ncbi:MAG: hypothetical protein ACYDAD_11590 [Acidimicrobiales bacterium]
MPTLSFEGETHDEIVRKVRRWLASTEADLGHLSPVQAVERASELTKDALSIVAAAAPGPVASNDVVKALTQRGYAATDNTRRAVVSGLNGLNELSGGKLMNRVDNARKTVVYEMNAAVARQVLRALKR